MSNHSIFQYQCPHCNETLDAKFSEITRDISVDCEHCGSIIHWHTCPDCLAGWCDEKAAIDCPSCHELSPAIPVEKINPFVKFFSKPCPWCQYPISMLKNIRFRRRGFQCLNCHKLVNVHRVAIVAVLIIILMIMLATFTPMHTWYQFMAQHYGKTLVNVIWLVGYYLALYLLVVKFCGLKKYDYEQNSHANNPNAELEN